MSRPGRAGAAAALALAAGACVAAPPPVTGLDSPRFAVRAGRPDYAATIRYIDTRVRYEDLDTRFAIGPTGDMCYVYEPGYAWCIPPRAVGKVRMDQFVEVHCSKWFPFCAYKLAGGGAGEFADKVQVRERFEDRAKVVAALHHLLHLMGGPDLTSDPFAAEAAASGG